MTLAAYNRLILYTIETPKAICVTDCSYGTLNLEIQIMIGRIVGFKRRVISSSQAGFLLPTVIALTVAIGMISVVVLQTVSRSSETLNNQYYDSLAKEAAQAGTAAAASCLTEGVVIPWTDATPLKPQTGCSGLPVINKLPYIAKFDNTTSTYEVKSIEMNVNGDPNTIIVTSVGTVLIQTAPGSEIEKSRKVDRTMAQVIIDPGSTPSTPTTPTTTTVSKNVVALSTGVGHACAAAEGDAFCWGRNTSGQLGNGSLTGTNKPIIVSKSALPQAATPGVCNNMIFGTCFGYSVQPTPAVPASPLFNKTVTKITAGNNHSCGIAEGKAYCWGANEHGQLGNRTTTDSIVPIAVDVSPVDTPAVGALPVGCGGFFRPACTSAAVPAHPASGLANKTVVDIQAGELFTCALTSDGEVACWGENAYGQLGVNDRVDRNFPVALYSSDAKPAVTEQPNPCGGLFQPTCQVNGSAAQPRTALYGKAVKSLAKMSSAQHMCVIAEDDLPYCWGRNFAGQVGNDVSMASHSESNKKDDSCPTSPSVSIKNTNDALQVQAVSMATTTSTTSWWGWTNTKQGSALIGKKVKELRVIDNYTTALSTEGRIHWWGGSTSTSTAPCRCTDKKKPNGDKYEECERERTRRYNVNSRPMGPVYNGGTNTCWFIIFSYGCDTSSILDNKAFTTTSGSANSGVFCGLSGSQLYCDGPQALIYGGWLGDNDTHGGLFTTPSKPVPVYMDGWFKNKSITELQAGLNGTWFGDESAASPGAFTCAIASQQVGCWGVNATGQLGTGDYNNRFAPTAVSLDSPLGITTVDPPADPGPSIPIPPSIRGFSSPIRF